MMPTLTQLELDAALNAIDQYRESSQRIGHDTAIHTFIQAIAKIQPLNTAGRLNGRPSKLLVGVNMDGLSIENIILNGLDLSRSSMRQMEAGSCKLDNCSLNGTDLEGSLFNGSEWRGCSVNCASFKRVCLEGSEVFESVINASDFSLCDHNDATFTSCTISRCDLTRCDLSTKSGFDPRTFVDCDLVDNYE